MTTRTLSERGELEVTGRQRCGHVRQRGFNGYLWPSGFRRCPPHMSFDLFLLKKYVVAFPGSELELKRDSVSVASGVFCAQRGTPRHDKHFELILLAWPDSVAEQPEPNSARSTVKAA